MEGGGEEVTREIIYLSLHCHHQNVFSIKIGSDKSRLTFHLYFVRDKVAGPCPQTTTLLKRKENGSGVEPRSFCLPAYNALPLGQTG